MDETIADIRKLQRQNLLIFLAVAAGVAIAFLLFHEQFHSHVLPYLGLSQKIGDTLGTMLILLFTFAATRLVSIVVYRDMDFGMSSLRGDQERRRRNVLATTTLVAAELRQVASYDEVIRKQLEAVVSETEKAAFDIADRLQTIDAVVGHLNSFVDSTAHKSSELLANSESRIAHNRDLIDRLENYIHEKIATGEKDKQRIDAVVREANSLSSLVQIIREISKKTTLLALNAAIEAARAGELGRGFAVVADEVRKLSAATDEAVAQVNDGIQAVAQSIESQFHDKITAEEIEAEKEALQSFGRQLDALGRSYQEVTAHEAEVMAEIGDTSKKLAAMFMDAMAAVQFQDVTRQQVEQVSNALMHLDTHTALLAERLQRADAPGEEIEPLEKKLEAMYGAYVMHTQRDSHRAALGQSLGGESASGNKVELF